VVPLTRAGSQVFILDHTSIRFGVTRPGPYLIKLTWSPYWQVARRLSGRALSGRDDRAPGAWRSDTLAASAESLGKDPNGFMVFEAPSAGVYELRFDVAGTAEAELTQ
jgi:hypothetical protein